MNFKNLICCLLIMLSGAAYGATQSPETQNPYWPAVAKLYQDGQYRTALGVLDQAGAHQGNTDSDKIWIAMMGGMIHANLGEVAQARSDFKRALSLDAQAAFPVEPTDDARLAFVAARSELDSRSRPQRPTLQLAAPAEPPSTANTGARLLAEGLAGGVGTAAFGALGLFLASADGGLLGLFNLANCVALGATLGVTLAGTLTGGTGSWQAATLGAYVGLVVSFAIILTTAQALLYSGNSLGSVAVFSVAIAGPVAGAMIGYEMSQRPRVTPTISPTPGGQGAIVGLAGIF